MILRCLCIALFCLVNGSNLSAQEAEALQLHKGINLSSWLANAQRQPLYERDFAQIKHAGFDNVRLPITPERLGFALDKNAPIDRPLDAAALDNAVILATHNGLAVVIDVHPDAAFMKTLEQESWAEQQFIHLWIAIAKHYKGYPAKTVAFELLNEPQYYGSESRYHAFLQTLVASIRKEDSTRWIIAGAPHGSSIEGLQGMVPLSDDHILYDFHFYEPYIVTHQGIGHGFETKMIRYFRDVPYPALLVNQDSVLYAPNASDPAQAKSELEAYVNAQWNAPHIADRVRQARQWADKYNVPVICGEFGVLRNHIKPESRYRWIADTRTALEANNIGWQLWDYTDMFGIAALVGETQTDPVDGSVKFIHPEAGFRLIELQALKALGLQ